MTAPHLSESDLRAHARRELPSAQALAASDHLLECAECQARFAGVRNKIDLPAPTYHEMAAWVDDELGPIERMEMARKLALGLSPAARAELHDLEEFKAEMERADAISRRHIPGWLLPLAAAVLLTGGGLWWKTHSPSVGGVASTKNEIRFPAFVNGLQTTRSVLASDSTSETRFHLVTPVATGVETGAPTFRWSPYPNATAYRIIVADTDSDDVLLTESVPAERTSWTPNKSFAREKTYRWEIEALHGEDVLAKAPAPPESDARFRVVGQKAADEIARARTESKGAHDAMGLAYATAGLVQSAEEEFEALRKENPASPLVRAFKAALAAARAAP